MRIKKTWFSYVLWGLFFITLFVAVGVSANGLAEDATSFEYITIIVRTYLIVAVGIGAVIGLTKLVENIYPKIESKLPDFSKASIPVSVEIALIVLATMIACALRVIVVFSASNAVLGSDKLFLFATNKLTVTQLGETSNGAYLFAKIISFMNSILGIKMYSTMCIQVIFQVTILLLVYLIVRKAFGKWQAMFTFGLMAFMQSSFVEVARLTQDSVLVLISVISFYIIIDLCKKNRAKEFKVRSVFLLYALAGALIGFLMYLDIIGVAVMLAGVLLIAFSGNDEDYDPIQRPLYQNLAFISTAVVVWAVLVMFLPMNGAQGVVQALISYGKQFVPSKGLDLQILLPGYGYPDSCIYFLFTGLWFGIFLNRNTDSGYPFVLIIVYATVCRMLGFDCSEYTLFAVVMWSIMAGIGLFGVKAYSKSGLSEEEIREREQRKEQKRREKELKADMSANMKTINLSPSVTDISEGKLTSKQVKKPEGSKKGYGIGKNTEEPKAKNPIPEKNTVSEKSSVTVEKPPLTEKTSSTEKVPTIISGNPPTAQVNAPKVPLVTNRKPDERHANRNRERVKEGNVIANDTSVNPSNRIVKSDSNSAINDNLDQNVLNEKSEPMVNQTIQNAVSDQIGKKSEVNQEGISQTDSSKDYVIVKTDVPIIAANGLPTEIKKTEAAPIIGEIKKSSSGYTGSTITQDSSTPLIPNNYFDVLSTPMSEGESLLANRSENYNGKLINPVNESVQNTAVESTGKDTNNVDSIVSAEETQNTVVNDKTISSFAAPVPPVKPNAEQVKRVSSPSRRVLKPEYQRGNSMIKNPLPTPKPHVAKNLDYDYHPSKVEMEFDIVDMKGKDYYDI